MTLAKTHAESCEVAPPASAELSRFSAPRLSLQKRKVLDDEPSPLSSVNSAFLCGLFADVAEAQTGSTTLVQDDSSECSRPLKRSCVSFSRSMIRTATTVDLAGQDSSSSSSTSPSPTNIIELIDQALSPTSITDVIKIQGNYVPFPQDLKSKSTLTQKTSISPTLKARDTPSSSSPRGNSEGPVFPLLPATISATSTTTTTACNTTLTRKVSDLQTSLAENNISTEKTESYGWFVEMDEEYSHETAPVYDSALAATDLAFQAHTAPKATNYDAELEWAKAADTVDDVLGDFF